jgi:hypothetical protein
MINKEIENRKQVGRRSSHNENAHLSRPIELITESGVRRGGRAMRLLLKLKREPLFILLDPLRSLKK